MTQFNIEDRIQAFANWWWNSENAVWSKERMTEEARKHFGDLKRGLTPEEVEAAVKALCAKHSWGYYPPGHHLDSPSMGNGIIRLALTRHAVTGGEGDGVDWKAKCGEERKQRDLDCDRANRAASRADAAEKELAEARARIAELEAEKRGDWSNVPKMIQLRDTIVSQAHEIRELKEARR